MLSIKDTDVGLVLGVPCSGDEVKLGRDIHRDDVSSRCAIIVKVPTLSAIENWLKSVIVRDDWKRLFTLFVIGIILAPSSRLDVDVKLISTIYDTTRIGSYNWGLFTLTQLTSGIKYYKR